MPSKDKERWERLAALGAKREIPTPEGEARMSAVILEVAEPLLKQHGNVQRQLLLATTTIWRRRKSGQRATFYLSQPPSA